MTDYGAMNVATLRRLVRDKGWKGSSVEAASREELIAFLTTGRKPNTDIASVAQGTHLATSRALVDDLSAVPCKQVSITSPAMLNAANAVNPSLPVTKQKKSHKGMMPNGRSAKGTPCFSKWFGRVHPSDVSYPSWKYLSKTSTDIANICKAKHDHAAHCGKKDASGSPWFEFTYNEAVDVFKISRPTFDKSIKQLVAVGFLKYRLIGDVPQCGNFEDGRGIPAQYQLSDIWKTWIPGMDEVFNPAAAKKGKKPQKKQNPSKPVFTSTSKGRFTSKAE